MKTRVGSALKSRLTQPPAPRKRRRYDVVDEEDDHNSNNITLGDPDLLDCPICYHLLQPPVFQCDNGHYVCESCCNKMKNKCPSCTLPVRFSRCRAIERIVESAKSSCVYMQYGCIEKISYSKKLDHENICKYSTLACPIYGCEFIDLPEYIYAHFATEHQCYGKPFNFKMFKSVTLLADETRVLLQEINEKILFVVHRIVDPLGSFVNVSCIAPPGLDMKFSYDLTAKKGENSITLTSSMEMISDSFAVPAKEKCHLIRNDLHEFVASIPKLSIQVLVRLYLI